MSNKLFIIILFLSASLLNAQNNEFTLETVSTPLSYEEIADAFEQLGLEEYRFLCDMESGYGIAFYVETYKKGKLVDILHISTIGQSDCKLERCTLFIIKEDTKVKISTLYTCDPLKMKGLASTQLNLFKHGYSHGKPFDNPVLKLGELTPIYLLVNDKESITFYPTLSIEETIARNDQVFIVKYELVKFKEIPDR
ncbi:MAG: hypothetical protein RAO94_00875 [Candidatus Stygibacter australis]|nr:hypothetical protein [Candidatus Stygibacter australis]MDP8320881.1 hypothetical protein [Candidatus Stygibacter australis]